MAEDTIKLPDPGSAHPEAVVTLPLYSYDVLVRGWEDPMTVQDTRTPKQLRQARMDAMSKKKGGSPDGILEFVTGWFEAREIVGIVESPDPEEDDDEEEDEPDDDEPDDEPDDDDRLASGEEPVNGELPHLTKPRFAGLDL